MKNRMPVDSRGSIEKSVSIWTGAGERNDFFYYLEIKYIA